MQPQAELLRIKVEGVVGRDIDPPRDQGLVVLEVATDSMNGTGIEGHHVPPPHVKDGEKIPRPARIEVYYDRVAHVLTRTRTKEDLDALEMAKGISTVARQRWLDEEIRPSQQERMKLEPSQLGRANALEDFLHLRCPINEWTVLSETMPKHRTGLPPLLFCRAVDLAGAAHDMGELEKRPQDFLRPAPPTPSNQTRLAADHQANVIASALSTVLERTGGGGSNAEIDQLRAENKALSEKLDAVLKRLDARDNRGDKR